MTVLAVLAAAAALYLPPKDDCVADASFRQFRTELRTALARKDVRRLTALTANDVMVDFGGGAGWPAFAEAWQLDRPAGSRIWGELELILSLGCTLEGETAASPSLMDQLPADRDAFLSVWVIKPDAAVFAAPEESSAVISRHSWTLLTLADAGGSEDWVAIALADGGTGYIRRENVRSPVDYRAVFQKRNGRWAMTALVAGD